MADAWLARVQLNKIFAVIGTPAPEDLEEVRSFHAALFPGVDGASTENRQLHVSRTEDEMN
eukprot:COSAG01_NODE_6856_length_3468_cov_1.978629_5_plen_61_part_00